MATFDFESVSVQEMNIRDTGTRTCIGTHITRSVSILSNLNNYNLFMHFQSRSFDWVICWCSCWVSNTEQSANVIKVSGDWDYFEEKTQSFFLHSKSTFLSHGKTIGIWIWMYGRRWARCVDTIFTNTKESTYWFAGSLGKKLQSSSGLWLQQRKTRP